ncbi:hypothetical protein GCM10027610_022370 [Dactylosporangium cerinum]
MWRGELFDSVAWSTSSNEYYDTRSGGHVEPKQAAQPASGNRGVAGHGLTDLRHFKTAGSAENHRPRTRDRRWRSPSTIGPASPPPELSEYEPQRFQPWRRATSPVS